MFVFIFQYIAGQSEFFLFSSACFHHVSDIRTKYPNECQRFDRLKYIQSKGLASVSIEIYGIYVMRAFDSNAQKEFICMAAYQYFVSVHCYHFSFSPSLHQNGVFCFVSFIFFCRYLVLSSRPAKVFAWYNQWGKSCLLVLNAKWVMLWTCVFHRTKWYDTLCMSTHNVQKVLYIEWKYFLMLVYNPLLFGIFIVVVVSTIVGFVVGSQ